MGFVTVRRMKIERFKQGWNGRFLWVILFGLTFLSEAIDVRSRDPYYSAVIIEAGSGRILWEDHASAKAYPASMTKMMNAFIVFDALDAGKITLDTPVTVTREIANIGGRQVWLKQGEVFSVEELLYAMLVHSANDSATALAIATSGTREAHVQKMNQKVQQLGLTRTEFHNVHGLPPGQGQQVDISSALDMARLGEALLAAHPEVLTYTSLYSRDFRPEAPVKMTSSNKLLRTVEGCDGLKTGYFRAGGFSITATAERNGTRIIAVVMGCKRKEVRNEWAEQLLERGFTLAQ